jgi:hypothetical protein
LKQILGHLLETAGQNLPSREKSACVPARAMEASKSPSRTPALVLMRRTKKLFSTAFAKSMTKPTGAMTAEGPPLFVAPVAHLAWHCH